MKNRYLNFCVVYLAHVKTKTPTSQRKQLPHPPSYLKYCHYCCWKSVKIGWWGSIIKIEPVQGD